MNLRSYTYAISASRHLLKRQLRHQMWRAKGLKFASTQVLSAPDFHFIWSRHSCPVVNHPSHSHLLASKVANMKKAATQMDGLLIRPGEIFSFWNQIGQPSFKRGFKSGPTFVRGEIVHTSGGGLCQISGLIYKLALEAGFKILERHAHTIDAYGERRYLPLGQDATVAWMSKDLCFQNSSVHEIRLRLRAFDDHAEGEIVSRAAPPFRVEIFQAQNNLKNGFQVVTTRTIRSENNFISEDLGLDEYRTLQPP